MLYYQKKGSPEYHWHKSCSKVPNNVRMDYKWKKIYSIQGGKKCKECLEKDKKKK